MRFSNKNLLVPVVSAGLLCLSAWPAAAAGNGEAIYKQRCAGCHGADGSGQTTMGKMFKLRDLKSPEVQAMTDAQLRAMIAHGKGKMPAFQSSLKPEQIDAVVAYVRELAKKK